jgi:hypothetical protein
MTLKPLLKSAGVGIAASALVLVASVAGQLAWATWQSPAFHQTARPSANTSSDDDFTVQTVEDIAAVTAPPWYVAALAGVVLVTAAGWQLRRSWRDRLTRS